VKCARCGSLDTKVLESRLIAEGQSIRRRRVCRKCDFRFTTYEKEEEAVFQIRKRSGELEPYHRDKALRSVQIACQKRPVKIEQMEFMLGVVERRLAEEGGKIISSTRLGDLIMEGLLELDKVAYVRFASVYKEFHSPSEFLEILQSF
jgi:transcriptional repressor NrdR